MRLNDILNPLSECFSEKLQNGLEKIACQWFILFCFFFLLRKVDVRFFNGFERLFIVFMD